MWWRWALTFALVVLDVWCVAELPFLWKSILAEQVSPVWIVAFYGGLWLIHECIVYTQEWLFFPIINNVIYNIQHQVVHHFHTLSYENTHTIAMAKVFGAIKRISMATRMFLKIHLLLVIPCILKVITSGVLIASNPSYGLLFMGAFVGLCCLIVFLVPWYGRIRLQAWDVTDEVGDCIAHSLLQTQVVRRTLSYERERLDHIFRKERDLWWKTNTSMNVVHILCSLGLAGMILGPLAMGIMDYRSGTLSKDQLIVLQGQLFLIAIPLRSLVLEIRQVVEAVIDIARIRDILHQPLPTYAVHMHLENHQVAVLKNVQFGFHKDQMLLTVPYAEIQQNQKILLQGPSGAGKSTLFNILSRTITVPEAHCVVNDHLSVLYIPQNAPLMNGTIWENCCYGMTTPPHKDEYKKALELCDLAAIIDQLPLKEHTPVGDLGTLLSGGERQRLLVVRALLCKPDVLIMDEAVDSIDSVRRIKVYEALWNIIPTIIWTSHHESAEAYATERWVLEHGYVAFKRYATAS